MTSDSKNITPVPAHPMDAPSTLSSQDITDSTIYITDGAVNRLRILISQEQKKKANSALLLRISVLSGGCSGFQYKFDFTETSNESDLVFTYEDITVVTDDVSFELLQNVTLDYIQELIGAAFTLRNPNAESSCGCGNSFSI